LQKCIILNFISFLNLLIII